MDDKIEVGEFVKIKNGDIRKVVKEFDKGCYIVDKLYYNNKISEKTKGVMLEDIIKHSKNPFKLLECEDIVILEYYVSKYRKRIRRKFEVFKFANLILFKNTYCDFIYNLSKQKFLDGKGYNPKIKSIVTKEQFESVSYKIEE